MNILITAPSLNATKNVSGISSIVNTIIENNKKHNYFHYLLGKPDKSFNKLTRLIRLFVQLMKFPFFVSYNNIELVHQNLPLDQKGVLRETIINIWCRLLNVPVLLHVHGGLFITEGTKNKLFLKLVQSLFVHSKQVIVLSDLEIEILKSKFNYKFAKVLSNSIDTSIYTNFKYKKKSNILTILYLGRIEKNKGIYEMIEAFKMLHKELNFRFVLCGTGPLKDYCTNACEVILGKNFEYKGIVSGENKIDIIKEANIFILPSYFEGVPMALLETMAAGVVPIVTNVGSMKQVIEHGVNGLLVEKQNSQDLFEKLKYIFLNQEIYESMSKKAKTTITEKYDISNYIIDLNKIYASINLNE